MFHQIHVKGMFEGFIVGKDKVHVSLLQFVDDTLIFCKNDEAMMEILRKTLVLCEWCSGQKVNWKRSAICGINIEERMINETASRLRCKIEKLPFMYLGLPLGSYPKSSLFWQPIKDKIQGKLSKWRRYNLSCGGRITLYKSVLSNLPTCYMSSFLMPISVSNILEKMMRNFF